MSDLDFLHQYAATWPEVPGEVFERATSRLPRSFPTKAAATLPAGLSVDVQLRVGSRSSAWRRLVVASSTSAEVIDSLVGADARPPVRLAAASSRHVAERTAARLAAFAAQRHDTTLLQTLVDNPAIPPGAFSDPFVLEVLLRTDVAPPPEFFDAERVLAAPASSSVMHRGAALFSLCHPDGPALEPAERRELVASLLAASTGIDPADVMLHCAYPLGAQRWSAPVDVPVDVAEIAAELLATTLGTRPTLRARPELEDLTSAPRLRLRGAAAHCVLDAAERLDPDAAANVMTAVDLDVATAAALARHGGPAAATMVSRWVLRHVDTIDDAPLADWAIRTFVTTATDMDAGDPDHAALALLTHRELDDDTALAVLRRSRRRLLTRWMLGLCPANQPNQRLVEALVMDPGLSTSRAGDAEPPLALGPASAAGSYPMVPLSDAPAWGYLHVPGVFDDVSGDFASQVRGETARRFCVELRNRAGDRTELWALAFELATGDHPIAAAAALDMVSAAVCDTGI